MHWSLHEATGWRLWDEFHVPCFQELDVYDLYSIRLQHNRFPLRECICWSAVCQCYLQRAVHQLRVQRPFSQFRVFSYESRKLFRRWLYERNVRYLLLEARVPTAFNKLRWYPLVITNNDLRLTCTPILCQ